MKYNLNKTPMGNLRVEFYNSFHDAGFGTGKTATLDLFDLIGEEQNPNPFIFKGKVSDCHVYPEKIKVLSAKHPELLSVKIQTIKS